MVPALDDLLVLPCDPTDDISSAAGTGDFHPCVPGRGSYSLGYLGAMKWMAVELKTHFFGKCPSGADAGHPGATP